MSVLSSLQVQTVLKKVPVAAPNTTEPILVNKKKLEYKWGMNVLGELMTELTFAALLCVEFPVTCCSVSPSRLDRLLHHLRDLHGQDGRAGEGHVRLLQHPQRDHHDDGFHDHVVSVLCLRARHASLFLLMWAALL